MNDDKWVALLSKLDGIQGDITSIKISSAQWGERLANHLTTDEKEFKENTESIVGIRAEMAEIKIGLGKQDKKLWKIGAVSGVIALVLVFLKELADFLRTGWR